MRGLCHMEHFPYRGEDFINFKFVFKFNFEIFKSKTKGLGDSCLGNFWKISNEVLDRIEDVNYLENKVRHNSFLKCNLIVA